MLLSLYLYVDVLVVVLVKCGDRPRVSYPLGESDDCETEHHMAVRFANFRNENNGNSNPSLEC